MPWAEVRLNSYSPAKIKQLEENDAGGRGSSIHDPSR
jgi:hypothetical protein